MYRSSSRQPLVPRFATRSLFLGLALLLACRPSTVPRQNTTTEQQTSSTNSVPRKSNRIRLLPDEQLEKGWISLFDGSTLFGWQMTGDVDWHVENDSLVATQGDVGFLYTTTTFSNYKLQLEFRCPPNTNSGVFLHMPRKPLDPTADCYEVNVAPPDNPFPTGSLVGRVQQRATIAEGDWNSMTIRVLGNQIRVVVNDQNPLTYTDPHPLDRGHIGLQHNQGRIEFRNIRLQPLEFADLFNGHDLSGWEIHPGLPSKFSVNSEGVLSVKNGKGQLETVDRFDDFVLQLHCKILGEHLNSGIFFRSIPGELWMGYESQIHNGYADGDRTRPTDCGTGGIFRRQNARYVVADDQIWFQKTIVADGPHLAVWVNGYQVSDWIDTREKHENPRQGLRTAAGTIIIQGHDPTTNLLFRNLRISKLRQRSDESQ